MEINDEFIQSELERAEELYQLYSTPLATQGPWTELDTAMKKQLELYNSLNWDYLNELNKANIAIDIGKMSTLPILEECGTHPITSGYSYSTDSPNSVVTYTSCGCKEEFKNQLISLIETIEDMITELE